MWQRSMSQTRIGKLSFAIYVVFGLLLTISAAGDAILEIGQVSGNPGDTVEVPIYLNLEFDHIGPSVLILELLFDSEKLMPDEEYYEFITRTSAGLIVRDSAGNATVTRSMLRLESNVTDADKVAELIIFPEFGIVRIVILGINDNIIKSGMMLRMAFKIDSGVNVGENLMIMWETLRTSAAEPSGEGLELLLEDGYIATGCEGPDAPVGLQATEGSRNGVELSWQAVGGNEISYRVYRSHESNLETALPLGTSWIDGTAFMDYSAISAKVLQHAGCRQPVQLEYGEYYYWVRARSADGCPGEFSDVAIGYRGQAKAVDTDLAVQQATGIVINGDFVIVCLIVLVLTGAYKCCKPGITARKTPDGTFSRNTGFIK